MASSKKRLVKGKAASKAKKVSAERFEVLLTANELEFVRDVFGMLIPVLNADASNVEEYVSQMTIVEYLAFVTKRSKLENALWNRLSDACHRANVVVGEAAPNYAVSAAHAPAMHVYEL